MQVDYKELNKQRKEQILKDGKYCNAEITIGSKEENPIMEIKLKNVGSKEVAILMLKMKEAIVTLAKKDPAAYYIFQNSKADSLLIDEDDIDKHIPRID